MSNTLFLEDLEENKTKKTNELKELDDGVENFLRQRNFEWILKKIKF